MTWSLIFVLLVIDFKIVYHKIIIKIFLSAVSSHNNEDNIPGRELRLMVYEKNTNKIVGFIRLVHLL